MFSQELLTFLNDVHSFNKYDTEVWYRGHSQSHYKLSPGLFRNVTISNPTDLSMLLEVEMSMYAQFLNLGASLHHASDWDLVYLMQHNGVPTRLLDWTSSLSVALWFALNDNHPSNDPHIWLLNPNALNYYVMGESSIPSLVTTPYLEAFKLNYPPLFNKTVAIVPLVNSPRISVQRGYFTLHGNLGIPLDQEPLGPQNTVLGVDVIKRIELSPLLVKELNAFVELSGIEGHFSLFPELPFLGKDLSKTFDKEASQRGILRP